MHQAVKRNLLTLDAEGQGTLAQRSSPAATGLRRLFGAINVTLFANALMILLPKFDAAQIVSLLPRASCLMGVPTFYTRLLAEPALTREAAAPEKAAAEFRSDGYFITGDLGRFDERGYLHIVGRGKDLIITGGYNVCPKEIESEIDALPGVIESAVFGVPHADFGEAVIAAVVRHDMAIDQIGHSNRTVP